MILLWFCHLFLFWRTLQFLTLICIPMFWVKTFKSFSFFFFGVYRMEFSWFVRANMGACNIPLLSQCTSRGVFSMCPFINRMTRSMFLEQGELMQRFIFLLLAVAIIMVLIDCEMLIYFLEGFQDCSWANQTTLCRQDQVGRWQDWEGCWFCTTQWFST